MAEERTPNGPDMGAREPIIDRGYTIRLSLASLLVGLVIAAPVGIALLALGRPAQVDEQGGVIWSGGMFVLPIAAVIIVAILYWSIFHLPLRIARRRGVILDPELWPWTGALALGVVIVLGFVAAILAGVI
ncbi:MAG: hypothetical protein IT323_21895 [Anaerolineae bacterium]|nr:hypothetical protein [Anaerolineae bacterium]